MDEEAGHEDSVLEAWVTELEYEVEDLRSAVKQTRLLALVGLAVASFALWGAVKIAQRLGSPSTQTQSVDLSTPSSPVEEYTVEDFSTKTPVAEAVEVPGSELSEKAKQIAEADQTVKLPEPPVA